MAATTVLSCLKVAKLIEIITEEHNYLSEKIESMESLDDYTEIVSYFTKHASEEEQMMRDNEYPDYHQHKDAHGEIIINLTSGTTRRSIQVLRQVVLDIVVNHMHTHDKQLLEFLESK